MCLFTNILKNVFVQVYHKSINASMISQRTVKLCFTKKEKKKNLLGYTKIQNSI